MISLKEYIISYKSLSITFLCFAILNLIAFFIIKKLYENDEDGFINNLLILSAFQKYLGIAVIIFSVIMSGSRELFISGENNRFYFKIPLLFFMLAGLCWTGIFVFILKLLRKFEMKKIKIHLLRDEISGMKICAKPEDLVFSFKKLPLKNYLKIAYLNLFIIVLSCLSGYYFSNKI